MEKTKATMSKHKPEILVTIGIGCMVASTVTAIKATPKAMQLLEAEKKALDVEELTKTEAIKATWKCYIPTAVTGVVGVGCLIGASSVSARRSAALATAYKLSETAFAEYKEKVIETIGEKKEKTVRDKVNKKKLESEPVRNAEVIVTGSGTTECYDVMHSRRFRCDIDKIKKAENEINRLMLDNDSVSLASFYREINLPYSEFDEKLGWHRSDVKRIELYYGSLLIDDCIPVMTVEFRTPPVYEYDDFNRYGIYDR